MQLTPRNRVALSAKITHLASSVIYFICGMVIAFVPEMDIQGRYIILGAASILFAGAGIYGYFSDDMYRLAFQSDMALGIFMAVFGVLLIVNSSSLPRSLPYFIGIISLIDGGNKFQISVEGKRFGMKMWFIVLILAAAEVALGVLAMIMKFRGRESDMMTGMTMAAVGAVNFWTTFYTVKVSGKRRDRENEPSDN